MNYGSHFLYRIIEAAMLTIVGCYLRVLIVPLCGSGFTTGLKDTLVVIFLNFFGKFFTNAVKIVSLMQRSVLLGKLNN